MELKCKFYNCSTIDGKFYNCFIRDQQIPENQEFKFIGQHEVGKANKDVTYAYFNSCTITKVPQGLTKIFPNLKVLSIFYSKLKKISKNDLVEYKNCKMLYFGCNEIEVLPEGLFEGFRNLEGLGFARNKLKVIAPNILDKLDKLKYANFRENINYDKCFSLNPYDNPNATLEDMKFDLRLKCTKHTLFDDFKAFIQDESKRDFKIIIDNREFMVHKLLLLIRCSTLADIIKIKPHAESLNLVDISVDIFEIILNFLYTDELPNDLDEYMSKLFAAAGRLKIHGLKEFAAFKIIQMINNENVIEILKLSNKYDHEEMRLKAFEALKKKYPEDTFKDELAVDMDELDKVIARINRKEEADRRMEEMFSI